MWIVIVIDYLYIILALAKLAFSIEPVGVELIRSSNQGRFSRRHLELRAWIPTLITSVDIVSIWERRFCNCSQKMVVNGG